MLTEAESLAANSEGYTPAVTDAVRGLLKHLADNCFFHELPCYVRESEELAELAAKHVRDLNADVLCPVEAEAVAA